MREVKTFQKVAKIESLPDRLVMAVLGCVIGTFILLGVGFSGVNVIHSAAHDARHANSFPCH